MKKIVLISILFAYAAPSLFAQLGGVDFSKVKKGTAVVTATTKDMSEDEEKEIGRVIAARILATYPLDSSQKLQKYVTLVGNTIAPYSSRPDLNWHFAVIKAPFINAFSTPGGYIFITSGAMQHIKSEAELAWILAHEIAHTTQKHIVKEVKRANVISAGASFAADGRGGISAELAERIGAMILKKLLTTGLGRKEELESDGVGLDLAAAAGYRTDAYKSFLETLQKLETTKSSAFGNLAKTHPKTDERIKLLDAKKVAASGVVLAERYKEWTVK